MGGSTIARSLHPEQVDALLELSQCFDQSENDVIAYDKLLTSLKDLIGFSSCSIHLLDGHGLEMYLVASRDIPESIPATIVEQTRHESLESGYMKPLLAKEPYLPTEHIACGDRFSTVSAESLFQGEMVKVPLIANGRLTGAMTLIMSEVDRTWFADRKHWLSLLGNHLGQLIEQRMDWAVRKSTALLQERAWMSEELTDHLLQYVSAIRLSAHRARQKWLSQDHEGMGQLLVDIEEMANDAYADIREEMISLSFLKPDEHDVLGRIREYLARFQHQWGMRIVFTVVDPAGALEHMQDTTAHLFRILQEALTNVRQHANATQAEVSLETDGRILRMLVVDNGCGFDANGVPEEKSGLKVMAARAAQINGRLNVTSSPENGTMVRMEVDLLNHRGVQGEQEEAPAREQAQARASASTPTVSSASAFRDATPLSTLTPREEEILVLLTDGLSNQEIATELTISEKTVKKHLNNVFAKLDVTNRSQAAVYAIRAGLS